MTSPRIRYACRALAECSRPPVFTLPIPLCRMHALEITNTMLPEITRGALNDERVGDAESAHSEAVRLAVPVTLDILNGHAPVVYFAQNGSLVKIGWSTSLGERLSALCLRRKSVLLALAGGRFLESALHSKFRKLQEDDTEWFRYGQPLAGYIRELQSRPDSISLTYLTSMLFEPEPRDRVVIERSPQPVPPPLDPPLDPAPEPEQSWMPPEQSYRILAEAVGKLRQAGVPEFGFDQIKDVTEATKRPKGWVYLQLAEAVEDGRLDKTADGWKFRTVSDRDS